MRLTAAILLLGCSLASTAAAQVLFDGVLGTRPDQQDWAYLTDPLFGASAIRSLGSDATSLDTTPDEDDKAGWFANFPPFANHPLVPVLDRTAGYTVRWRVRLDEESHSSVHRAGLSVIVLSSDLMGVEIAHWTDEVWVQDDGPPLFQHGEGAAFDGTSARVEYELCVLGDSYRLRADGELLFQGELRDYSAFGAPYDIPDFLFLGDDTTSAEARFEWAHFELELEACECRVAELDSDADGTPDCADGCVDDPAKTAPGDCGCGLPERDPDGDGTPDCDAIPGDIHPDGVGDDEVSLADFLLAHRKLVLGSSVIGPWDLLAADLASNLPPCEQPDARLRSCAEANRAFDIDDGRAVRALVARRLELSCEPCAGVEPPLPSELRLPGDVAPRGENGDALVDVADTVLALRWAVSLDLPLTAEELLRADVAPSTLQGPLAIVQGNGFIDVADVILILRAAVSLSELVWPTRELRLELIDGTQALAFNATSSGWPAWARAVDFVSTHCDVGALDGLDAVAGSWSVTCASEPAMISGPTRLGTFRYRAPRDVAPATLLVSATVVGAALEESAASVELEND